VGGQSALPSPSGEGVTEGDGWGVLPQWGKMSCVSKTDGEPLKTLSIKQTGCGVFVVGIGKNL